MWIKNAWYIAAWASNVRQGEILARTYLNTPVILYRTGAGELVAMEDRCCHRLAPLSKGRLEGDDVRCMYHGLKFAPSGQCVEVPGTTDVPSQLHVTTFPVVEKNQLVWIWMGDPALADPNDIIDWPYFDDQAWRFREGYLTYDADYRLIADNLLDLSHLNYVHEKSIGSSADTQTTPEYDKRDDGMNIKTFWLNDEPAPHHKTVGNFTGKVDRWNIYDWHIHGNLFLMDAGTGPTGGLGHQGDRSNCIEFRHLSVLTPETANTCHYHWAHAHNFSIDDDTASDAIYEAVLSAFEEDRDIIEAQQKVIDMDPTRPMQAVHFDAPIYLMRRRTEQIIDAENAEQSQAAE